MYYELTLPSNVLACGDEQAQLQAAIGGRGRARAGTAGQPGYVSERTIFTILVSCEVVDCIIISYCKSSLMILTSAQVIQTLSLCPMCPLFLAQTCRRLMDTCQSRYRSLPDQT
jgi:hypothetical protein